MSLPELLSGAECNTRVVNLEVFHPNSITTNMCFVCNNFSEKVPSEPHGCYIGHQRVQINLDTALPLNLAHISVTEENLVGDQTWVVTVAQVFTFASIMQGSPTTLGQMSSFTGKLFFCAFLTTVIPHAFDYLFISFDEIQCSLDLAHFVSRHEKVPQIQGVH